MESSRCCRRWLWIRSEDWIQRNNVVITETNSKGCRDSRFAIGGHRVNILGVHAGLQRAWPNQSIEETFRVAGNRNHHSMSIFPQPYPFYEQPDEFKDEFDHERSRDLAKKHFEWFVANVPNRVAVLTKYFSFEPTGDVRADLL